MIDPPTGGFTLPIGVISDASAEAETDVDAGEADWRDKV
jgi:hypothetical protein